MILLIAGATHTGKTALAQRLLEKYHYPYLSVDHLKMGLIRSGYTSLTPADDDRLTDYLWPVVREMIKTNVENGQHLIVEGCYIPFSWKRDFEAEYLRDIRCIWLIMSEAYIEHHFAEICSYARIVEQRPDDAWCTRELLLEENKRNLRSCREYGCEYILIDGDYRADVKL